MNKRKMLLTTLAITLVGLAVINFSPVYAQTNNNPNAKPNFFSELIQTIAQKFGLDKNKVQAVVDDFQNQKRTQMQQNTQQREKTRLDQLVKDGKITAAQKQAILKELETLRNKYNGAGFNNMTPDQRKQQMQARQEEVGNWAKSQGIDPSYVTGFGQGGPMKRGSGGQGRGLRHNTAPTPSQ